MRTDSIRWPSASSWTALAVMPPSAPMMWLSAMVLNRNAVSSASRRAAGRSVRSAKLDASGRCAPSSTWPARYAGSPRAASHAASDGRSISLIAGREPARGSPPIRDSVTPSEDQPRVVQERQERRQRAGDVRPRGGLEDGAGTGLLLADHAESVDEGERLARRSDLDRQRRGREEHGRTEAEEADDGKAPEPEEDARDEQPRRDAGAELRGRHDRLTQLHGRLAGMVLEGVADLVRDDRRSSHRQARAAGHDAG